MVNCFGLRPGPKCLEFAGFRAQGATGFRAFGLKV